jgi:hypothetical protein
MKRILLVVVVAVCVVIVHSKTVIAQDAKAPGKTKTERHIKMLKVDDNGMKTEIDTVLTGDAPFVWNGDTIGGAKEFKWIARDGVKMDSMHHFDYKIEGDGKRRVMIMHSPNGEPMMWENTMPGVPPPPHAPKVMMFRGSRGKNVIDLSDPGIISYDKKIQKDGTEKITIVRKQVPENEEIEQDVLIHAPGEFHMGMPAPGSIKTVRVIKSDDGTTRVIEDENAIQIEGKEGTTKFVGDDGKVIIVKEMKEGDQKKVEVTVEEEKKEVQEKK